MNDEFDGSAHELAERAKINFENLAKTNPGVKAHPFFVIAMVQLNAAIAHMAQEIEPEEVG